MDELRMYIASLPCANMVTLSAVKIMSLLTAAILAASVMLITKTVRKTPCRNQGRTLLAIVFTLGVGAAFETTGSPHARLLAG